MNLPKLLLDALEELEHPLLSWGYVDGSFSYDDVYQVSERLINEHGLEKTPSEPIEALLKAGMLLRLRSSTERYRTRMAETVRLAAQLRQILPHQPWPIAPSLVYDYRFDFKSRQRPTRPVTPAEIRRRLDAVKPLTGREQSALDSFLTGKVANLAKFQAEATVQIRERVGARTSATIVCAGTGSGKTIAFYLPCLLAIAERISHEEWTQAMVVYPRKVLLADQFTKAYSEARKLDSVVPRKIRIGAFFGDAPKDHSKEALDLSGWRDRNRWICPFLKCPTCGSTMEWQESDRVKAEEKLHCTKQGCGTSVGPDEVALTKKRVRDVKPDILFTTTEMLHKEISAQQNRRVFGIGCRRKPYLVLLDEAHTYYGTHGAQVALVLRRWKHALAGHVQFVGLSATLGDPAGFFSDLVGVPGQWVQQIDVADDLVPEGREYRLVLRSSGTGVLSTSLQAIMLISRMLDPLDRARSHGLQPPKLFAFTDDLDVNNRMFHYLLDAEGQNWRGNPIKDPLAFYRSPQDDLQDAVGQSWWSVEEIGNHLDRGHPMAVGRISSKDPGLDNDKKVIVATSSLEVGYDDNAVGAVLQHKAPRGAASFLQRKGRSGRDLKARPWTVLVLSDFGRDRYTFQTWEHVFDPIINRPPLPIKNRYVLKMQATAALIDWLGTKLGDKCTNIWRDLGGVSEGSYEKTSRNRHLAIARELRNILEDSSTRQQLAETIAKALDLLPNEVTAVLWEPPRALMTAVIPTLVRRLESGWAVQGREGFNADGYSPNRPLYEFISDNLFSDLNVPELEIEFEEPTITGGSQYGSDIFRIAQGMRESAPGRVSRRFSIRAMKGAHWVPPLDPIGDPWSDRPLPIDQYCPQYDEIGTVTRDGRELRLLMPRSVREVLVPLNVKASTNARHEWHTEITLSAPGILGDEARGAPLSRFIRAVRFHTLTDGNPVQVCRYSTGTQVNFRAKPNVEYEFRVPFMDEQGAEPVAVGFTQEVDAVCFECDIDPLTIKRAKEGPDLPSLRAALYRHRVAAGLNALRREFADLRGLLNPFDYDWVANIFLAAVALRFSDSQSGIQQTVAGFAAEDDWSKWLRPVMRALFLIDETHSIPAPDDDDLPPGLDDLQGPLRFDRVRDIFANARVRTVLVDHASILSGALGPDTDRFVRGRIKAALAGCLMVACVESIPDCDPEDLILDLEPGPATGSDPDDQIWISEQVLGGAGLIERLHRLFTLDPRAFYLRVELAALPGDLESADCGLREIVRLITHTRPDFELSGALGLIRDHADNRVDLQRYQTQLQELLTQRHFGAGHTFMVALNARLLRPGSGANHDHVLKNLLCRWEQLEDALGFEVDVRAFAAIAANESKGSGLYDLIGSYQPDPDLPKLYAAAYSMLWARGSEVRRSGLETYNPFALPMGADPIHIRTLLGQEATVDVARDGWEEAAEASLHATGTVRLRAGAGQERRLSDAVRSLLSMPVDTGFIAVYPSVVQASASYEGHSVVLHIKENI